MSAPTIRLASIALGLLPLMLPAQEYSCTVLDQQEVQLGFNKAIQGRCSNNGLAITCTLDENQGWSCEGPGEAVASFDLSTAVFSACGCKADPFFHYDPQTPWSPLEEGPPGP